MGKRHITRKQQHKYGGKNIVKRKHSHTRRKIRRGGMIPTPGDRLMDMLHQNSQMNPRPFSNAQIAAQFNRVGEDDLYQSIMRKKEMLSPEDRCLFSQEAWRHQEDPMSVQRISECPYARQGRCRRRNPVHRLADKSRAYHPATLVAMSITDTSF